MAQPAAPRQAQSALWLSTAELYRLTVQ